jgi:hypothetical protein
MLHRSTTKSTLKIAVAVPEIMDTSPITLKSAGFVHLSEF